MTLVYVVVGLLMAVGVVGSLLPFLPGTPLVFAGALVYAFATDFDPIGPGRLAILGGLAALAYALEHLAAALGAKRYGGSRWAVIGALVGTVIGLFLGPIGIIVGAAAGAVAGELLRSGDLTHSIRSGMGAFIGMLAGTVASFGIALAMVGLFLWWVWRA